MTAPSLKCEFCDKRGLPLLLVRDAIVPADGGAPRSADQPRELVGTVAHYTKRLLREGYLNVYDDARKRWESYYVTPDGYFFKLLQTRSAIPVKLAKPFNCPDEGHAAVASCITVPDPKNATKVWIGFSDTPWTAGVRKKNEDLAYRKRHMVGVDVKAALAGGKVPHARPISHVSIVVAEYAMAKDKGQKAFNWSPAKFVSRQGKAERLRKECDAMRPGKGLIVTVPDPVGITEELALLTQSKLNEFTHEPTRRRFFLADQAISGIEQGVRDNAKLQEKAAADYRKNQNMRGSWAYSKELREENEKFYEVSPTEAARAADLAWKRYTNKFETENRDLWRKEFLKGLTAHDDKFVAPLALSHVAWFKSEEMVNYFECNFDSKDPAASADYVKVFTKCAVGTQDKGPAVELYKKWLDGEVTDTKNLLLRAFVGNQDKIADAVANAVNVNLSLRAIPWDNLLGTLKEALGRFSTGVHDALTDLIVAYAGPIASALGRALDGKLGLRGFLVLLGIVSERPVVKLTFTGKRKEFRRLVAKTILSRSGLALDEHQLSKAIGAQMTLDAIEGVRMDGDTRMTYVGFLDKDLPGMPTGLTMQQKVNWAATHLHGTKALEELNANKFRTIFPRDARFAILAGIAQAVSLSKLIEDESKALGNTHVDAMLRLSAGVVALSATTGEIIGSIWAGVRTMKYGAGVATVGTKRLLNGAKVLGLFAGLGVAILDIVQGVQAYKERQYGLAWLYGGAAVAGASLTFMLAFPTMLGASLAVFTIPIIAVLFIIVVLIGIAIEYKKDNAVHDWLERCVWGKLKNERYADEATEQAELKKAIA